VLDALECRLLTPELAGALERFFAELRDAGDEADFHPHPLDATAARAVCSYAGADLHYGLVAGDDVLGYGLLRGWDAGFEIPSLGIAIAPSARGRGLGRLLLSFLHSAAALRGAEKVRLKVYERNEAALDLYRRAGYEFDGGLEDDQLVGIFDLRRGARV
jgi:ribosomal protein S18 acetylase RimI-like enzyme